MYRTTAATSAHFEMFPQAPVRRARLNKRTLTSLTSERTLRLLGALAWDDKSRLEQCGAFHGELYSFDVAQMLQRIAVYPNHVAEFPQLDRPGVVFDTEPVCARQ